MELLNNVIIGLKALLAYVSLKIWGSFEYSRRESMFIASREVNFP
jgi:hypothetical protein